MQTVAETPAFTETAVPRRAIYYLYDGDHPILAPLVYCKGEADDLSPAGKRQLSSMVAEIKAAWKGK